MFVLNDEGHQMTWLDIQRQERAPAPKGIAFYGSFCNAGSPTRVFARNLRDAVLKLREYESNLPPEWNRHLLGVFQYSPPVSANVANYLVRFQMYDSPSIISW